MKIVRDIEMLTMLLLNATWQHLQLGLWQGLDERTYRDGVLMTDTQTHTHVEMKMQVKEQASG